MLTRPTFSPRSVLRRPSGGVVPGLSSMRWNGVYSGTTRAVPSAPLVRSAK